jgi:hypothetical protein
VLALFGIGWSDESCPLLGEDRKSPMRALTSENDPQQTFEAVSRSLDDRMAAKFSVDLDQCDALPWAQYSRFSNGLRIWARAWPKRIPVQRSNRSPSWTGVAGMWMPSGQMASLSMLMILDLALRHASGLPRSRKRGFKNTQYLGNRNDHQACSPIHRKA